MIEPGQGKTCFGCRWNGGSWPAGQNRKCVSPHLRPRHTLVEGPGVIAPARCDTQRSWLWRKLGFNTCGPEARYWERGIGHRD